MTDIALETGGRGRSIAGIAYRVGRAVTPYALALYIADIFLTYLPFKFAANNYIFGVLEEWSGLAWVEPDFRFFTGSAEALAAILLFIPGLQLACAGMALAVMSGAIFAHVFTPLGIDPFNDGGRLFTEAVTVWFAAAAIIAIRRHEILPFVRRLVVDQNLVRAIRGNR